MEKQTYDPLVRWLNDEVNANWAITELAQKGFLKQGRGAIFIETEVDRDLYEKLKGEPDVAGKAIEAGLPLPIRCEYLPTNEVIEYYEEMMGERQPDLRKWIENYNTGTEFILVISVPPLCLMAQILTLKLGETQIGNTLN